MTNDAPRGTSSPRTRRSLAPALAIVGAIVLVAGGGWWFLRSQGGDSHRPRLPMPERAGSDGVAAPASAGATNGAEPLTAQRMAEPLAPAPTALGVRAPPESFTRELAGLRGRVVEQDGTPVADLKVELLRLHTDLLAQALQGGFEQLPPELVRPEVATGATGADGRFVLQNAEVGSLALLGIDLGGPRGTARLIDVALERGQSCDLGDVVLPPHVTFTGTVVDEDEKPVAGARIRVIPQLPAPIPTQAIEIGLQDIRSDCAGLLLNRRQVESIEIASRNPTAVALEMPGWLRAAFDRLPLPTTRSESDGRFRLTGVPAGLVTLLVDRPGFVGLVRAGLPTGRSPEHDVGKFRLSSGRTVTGRVLAGEAPVAGVRLFVGSAIAAPFDDDVLVAIGQPVASPTDADGRFTITGLPVNGDLLCAVQPIRGDPWRVLGPFDHDDVTLTLPAVATLTVTVTDPAGAPVADAALRFEVDDEMSELPILRAPIDLTRRTETTEPGQYVVRDLPVGKWLVYARGGTFGIQHAAVDLRAEGAAVTIALPPARALSVHVVAAASGTPVDYALVAALVDPGHFIPMPFAVARCDLEGSATLTQLPAGGELLLRITHPGFAPAFAKAPEGSASPIEVALLRGGDLIGTVACGGKPPSKPVMFLLTCNDHSVGEQVETEVPRFAITLPDGTFRIRHLPAGKWNWRIYPRFFAADPIALVKTAMDQPDELATGECTIEEGKETQLAIEAQSDGERLPCTVHGHVGVSGRSEAGLEVRMFGRRYVDTQTDAAGRFEFADVRPGEYRLQVARAGDGSHATLHEQAFVLASGETKEVDVDVRIEEVTVTVTTRAGQPVHGAEVEIVRDDDGVPPETAAAAGQSGRASGRTDASGLAKLPLGAGRYRATASHAEIGRVTAKFAVVAGAGNHVELVLEPGVRVAGRFEFRGPAPAGKQWHLTFNLINAEDDDFVNLGNGNLNWMPVDADGARFEVKVVMPGRYRAQLYADEGILESQEFDVGPNGNGDLVLRMQARE